MSLGDIELDDDLVGLVEAAASEDRSHASAALPPQGLDPTPDEIIPESIFDDYDVDSFDIEALMAPAAESGTVGASSGPQMFQSDSTCDGAHSSHKQKRAIGMSRRLADKAVVAAAKERAENMSLSEKRSAAAKARWKAAKNLPRPPDADQANQESVLAIALPSPMHMNAGAILPFASAGEHDGILATIMTMQPDQNAKPTVEPLVWKSFTKSISQLDIADRCKISRRTVKQRLHALACITMMFKRCRGSQAIEAVHKKLCSLGTVVTPVEFIVKWKYDEMSVTTSVPRGQGMSGTDKVLTKMLQVCVTWACAWLVDGVPVNMVVQIPFQLKAIEKNTTKCTFWGLVNQVQAPPVSQIFKKKSLMPIADDHASNRASECAIWFLSGPNVAIERWRCTVHKEDKIGKLSGNAFAMDQRGMLHLSLSLQYAGATLAFRRKFREYLRKPGVFKYIPWGEHGSERSQKHNASVFNTFYSDQSGGKLGQQNSDRMSWFHSARSLFNGRLRNKGVVEHWCKGCCQGPEHCLNQIDTLVINNMFFPSIWKSSTWSDMEQAIDFCALWLSIHNILEEVYITALLPDESKKKKNNAGTNGIEAIGNEGHEKNGSASESEPEEDVAQVYQDEDFVLPELDKQESPIVRQNTFRVNVKAWLQTKPLGRLFALKKIHRVQQRSQHRWFKHAGRPYELAEMSRRANGLPPQHRIILFGDGYYSDHALTAYSKLMRGEGDSWDGLPEEFQTHDIALPTFKATAAACAAKEQLHVQPSKHHPVRGYQMLKDPGSDFSQRLAHELIEEWHTKPCSFDGFWYEHIKQHDTVDKLLSSESSTSLLLHCELIELENVNVETNNASIRRDCHRCTQKKTLDVNDLDANWVLRQDKADNALIKSDSSSSGTSESSEEGKAATGKGGRYRAFVSRASQKDENRTADGRVDFKKIAEAWHIEMAKE